MSEQNENFMEFIDKYLPEIKQGIAQGEVDGIISRLMAEKTVAERNMNIAIKRFIEVAQDRDQLESENVALKAQIQAMIETMVNNK